MHANESLLREAIDALLIQDRGTLERLIADDVIVHFPGRSKLAGDHRGRGVLGALILELSGSPLDIRVHDVLGSDQHAVGIYTFRAGSPDRQAEWRHVNVYHIDKGQIVEVWQNPFEQETVDEFFQP